VVTITLNCLGVDVCAFTPIGVRAGRQRSSPTRTAARTRLYFMVVVNLPYGMMMVAMTVLVAALMTLTVFEPLLVTKTKFGSSGLAGLSM